MELSEDDVLHILKLIDESKFDYFQLEVGELKITVSKGDPIPLAGTAPQPAAVNAAPSCRLRGAPNPRQPAAAPAAPAAKAGGDSRRHVAVTAPLLGTFYVAPEPGAPPFVKVGQQITEDTTCRSDRSDESLQQRARHRQGHDRRSGRAKRSASSSSASPVHRQTVTSASVETELLFA